MLVQVGGIAVNAFFASVITATLGFISAVAVLVLDYWKPSRKRKGWIKRLLAICTILLIISTAIGGVVTKQEAENDKRALNQKLTEISAKLDPFIEVARQQHPGVPESDALTLLRRDVVSIQKRISNRAVSDELRAAIREQLGPLRGQRVVLRKFTEQEADRYAEALAGALRAEAGLDVQVLLVGVMSSPVYGLECGQSPVGQAFAKAVGVTGATCNTMSVSVVTQGVDIFVGLKPST